MITAEFKTYGVISLIFCGIFVLALPFLIGLLVEQIVQWDSQPFARSVTPAQLIVLIVFLSFLWVVFLFTLFKYALDITIDPDAKTILFTNILTDRSKLYDFTEFDGYLDTIATSKAGTYKVVYLIKNQKAERIITGFYFSNIDELKAALSPIKYQGFREDFSRLARKALLRKPLID